MIMFEMKKIKRSTYVFNVEMRHLQTYFQTELLNANDVVAVPLILASIRYG